MSWKGSSNMMLWRQTSSRYEQSCGSAAQAYDREGYRSAYLMILPWALASFPLFLILSFLPQTTSRLYIEDSPMPPFQLLSHHAAASTSAPARRIGRPSQSPASLT